jgi:hypothetical protein
MRNCPGLGLLAVVIVCAGCKGSSGLMTNDGGPPDRGGTGEAGGGTPMSCVDVQGADKIAYSATTIPGYTCDSNKSTMYPTGLNACRNQSDCGLIATGKVREIVRTCGLSCRSYEPDCAMMAMCNTDCVTMATANMIAPPGISERCGQCYTGIALCSLEYCLSECAANADAIDCVKCQFTAGCRVAFERCSGLDRQ